MEQILAQSIVESVYDLSDGMAYRQALEFPELHQSEQVWMT